MATRNSSKSKTAGGMAVANGATAAFAAALLKICDAHSLVLEAQQYVEKRSREALSGSELLIVKAALAESLKLLASAIETHDDDPALAALRQDDDAETAEEVSHA